MPFFFLTRPPPIQNRGGAEAASVGGGQRRPRGRRRPGVGETEGESRGSQSRAYLGSGSLVEAAPRRQAAVGYGGWGGGAWRLGR
jgi:hypothetical protein